jgi:Tfp pilus assembly protein PilX
MIYSLKNQKGFVASVTTLLVLIFMISVGISMSILIFGRAKISVNAIGSAQSYYAAEAGIEDALLRLKNSPQLASASYSVTVNNATASVNIPGIVGGSRSITSQGTNNGLVKTIQVVYSVDTQNVNFYYGAEVGEGGLTMSNGSRVMGNVFSAGNISGTGTIDNDAVISGNGHSISGVYVGGNVLAHSCLSPASVQNLTYVTGGTHTCTVRPGGNTSEQSTEISAQPLPIPDSQIADWKTEATNGNVIIGDVTIDDEVTSLGPVKITGNLTLDNQSTLTMTGTVYVVGNIILNNGSTIKLSSTYGTLGGVLLTDGTASINNNIVFLGSGQTGSYVLLLSTSTSDAAINVGNNATNVVLYTNQGGVQISNNVTVTEVTAYKLSLANNAKVQYSTGVVNIFFSSGTGGGWKVTNWQEQ